MDLFRTHDGLFCCVVVGASIDDVEVIGLDTGY